VFSPCWPNEPGSSFVPCFLLENMWDHWLFC
jgi:hypothetical protein